MTNFRPRILQVCAVDFTARHFLLPLMRAQREAGFDVHLACHPGPDVPALEAEGFPVHPVAFERSIDLGAHARAWVQLGRLLRGAGRVNPKAGSTAAGRRSTPAGQTEPVFAVVHAHTPVAAMIARPAARRAGVPVVIYTAHGFYFHDRMAPWLRRLHVALERWAQRRADYLFTQSAEDLETAVREGIAPAARAEAIGNGVDLARFDRGRISPARLERTRRELGLEGNGGPLVIMIGRLVREKGVIEFLQALAEVRRAHAGAQALIIGEALPSDRAGAAEDIRRLAAALGLTEAGRPAVIFTGLRRDVPELLALGDVFCLPSWREGMPRSIIEAMAAGLPVVASAIRGCREEVAEGETGLLVPPRDVGALAGALGRLAADPALRARLGAAGRRRAEALYDEERVVARQMARLRILFAEKSLAWPPAGPGGASPQGAVDLRGA
ncbi:MAG: glycosyltransferase family 4 protein [bacterium]|nr:glycosyltransferase family 4 protein [bacterium]